MMFSILDTDFQKEEIFNRISPRLQAQLSKTHKQLADERKYQEMIDKPFEHEELEKVDVNVVYTLVGDDKNHIFASWSTNNDEFSDNLYLLHVNSSSKVENGVIVNRIKEFFFTGLGGYEDSVPDIEQVEYFTKIAYNEDIPINENFDFISYIIDVVETPKVKARVYFSLSDVYMIYTLRCRNLYIDEEKYALRATLEYYEELMSYILPEEFNEKIDEEISLAKYYLDLHPLWM